VSTLDERMLQADWERQVAKFNSVEKAKGVIQKITPHGAGKSHRGINSRKAFEKRVVGILGNCNWGSESKWGRKKIARDLVHMRTPYDQVRGVRSSRLAIDSGISPKNKRRQSKKAHRKLGNN